MSRHLRSVVAALFGIMGVACAVSGAESALDFSYSDSRVAMATNIYQELTNMTLSAWIKPTARPATGSYGAIAGRGYLNGAANGFGLLLYGTGGIAVFQTRNGGTVVEAAAPYPFDGKWHHLAGVREGDSTRLYLDGAQVAEATGSLTNLYTPGIAFALGMVHTGGLGWYYPFKGAMAEVRFWNQACTPAQLQNDMFRRLAGTEAGLAGYWPLDEGTGITVADRTPAGKHGVSNRAVWLSDITVAALLPVSRDLARLGYWPFTLADLRTGSARSTDTNVVTVTGFPILPAGYNAYQVSTSSVSSAVVPGAWISTNTPPAPTAFSAVAEGKPAALFAWFTNTLDTVPLRRSGASILYATMGTGRALDFTYAGARVEMAQNLWPTLTNLTLSVWIKTSTKYAANNYGSIAGRGYLGSLNGFGLFINNDNTVVFQTRYGGTTVSPFTPYPFDDKWHHLAGVREGNDTRLYLDGVLKDTKSGALASLYLAGTPFALGMRYASGWGYPFYGTMAEVRLWNQARTQAQIQAEMFQCLAGSEPGLVGYWPLNEGTGAVAADWVAGNHGTRYSAYWTTDTPFGPMMSASGAYLGNWPFTLADLETGNTRVTDSNVVAVAGLPVPAGYDVCQLSASPAASEIDPGAWVSTNALPDRFTLSTTAGRCSLYAWFTNTAASVPLRRSAASIVHFPAEAALDFRASAQNRVTMTPDLYPGVTNLTLTAWIKTSTLPAANSYGAIAGRGYLYGSSGFGLFVSFDGNAYFQVRNGASILQPAVVYPFDGKWHHLAGVHEVNTARLYLDGELVAESTAPLASIYSEGVTFGLGMRDSGLGWDFPFEGAISEVRLWKIARTQAQIKDEMFRCLADTEAGLIGYWPLSEGTGTAVTDRTDAGNNGTVVNGAAWLKDKSVAALLPVSRDPSRQGYWPLTLTDLTTADTLLTDSNVVTVAGFPVPTGYTSYRISTSPTASVAGPGDWVAVTAPPATLAFADTVSGSRAALFAWFTNTAASVPLRRSGGSMIYATQDPALAVTTTTARAEMAAGLYPTLTNMTLSAWVKTSVVPAFGSYGSIAGRGYLSGAVNGFGLFVTYTGEVQFQTRNGDIANIAAAAPYPFGAVWHHLAGVREGNMTRLYLDGELAAESPGAVTNLYTSGVVFGLGMRHNGVDWGFPFNGAISEVRLWNYARSRMEIRSDMHYRLTGAEPGLIGYWPLDEAEGRWVEDLTAAGNDGRLNNEGWEFTADFIRVRPPPGTLIRIL